MTSTGAAIYPLFQQLLVHAQGQVLVIIDENIDPAQLGTQRDAPGRHYHSNRFDVCRSLVAAGATSTGNDYDFSAFSDARFDGIYYRLSKEKAVVHHLINSAGRLLKTGGHLTLLGHKNEGLKSYSKSASAYLGGEISTRRGRAGYTAVSISRAMDLGNRLEDGDYPHLRPAVEANGNTLYSKPGIYGWEKIDQGSALLVAALKAWLLLSPATAHPRTVLDLGCGYGYLSIMAARLFKSDFVATDNNFAAVTACTKNFQLCDIHGRVVADDCGAHIQEKFDLVLCNPPFHQGFETSGDIADRFLQQAAAHLKPGGSALFVVNQFIGLERRAINWFSSVEEMHRENGFKIFRLSH